jgi:hypothetical protein
LLASMSATGLVLSAMGRDVHSNSSPPIHPSQESRDGETKKAFYWLSSRSDFGDTKHSTKNV